MVCEILCVGTELLLGDIINTDGAFIARELALLGFLSYRQTVVGDNAERLREAVREAFGRADIVILTGGLGPTCDDITKTVVADCFGKKLHMDEGVRKNIEEFFARIGRTMTENNLSQAMIPEGAEILHNKWGTAPGIAMSGEVDGDVKYAILLPGPPSECEPMFMECAKPYLMKLSGAVLYSLNLHLYGIGESAAEQMLRELMESSENPTVAPYAGEHEVRIRITARADDAETAKAMCREMAERISKTDVGRYVYTETDDPFDAKHALAATMIRELRTRGYTVATAESCTAGMISSAIGDIPGASDVFPGSIVSYANDVKEKVLGVSAETLAAHGAVSVECAGEMAEGARRVIGADIAVSVTGIAGPGGGTPTKPVGTVCFGLAGLGETYTEIRHFNGRNDRARIRRLTCAYAMMLVIKRLRGEL